METTRGLPIIAAAGDEVRGVLRAIRRAAPAGVVALLLLMTQGTATHTVARTLDDAGPSGVATAPAPDPVAAYPAGAAGGADDPAAPCLCDVRRLLDQAAAAW